jgi:hypothetical protein
MLCAFKMEANGYIRVPSASVSEEERLMPLNRALVGPQSRCGRGGENGIQPCRESKRSNSLLPSAVLCWVMTFRIHNNHSAKCEI